MSRPSPAVRNPSWLPHSRKSAACLVAASPGHHAPGNRLCNYRVVFIPDWLLSESTLAHAIGLPPKVRVLLTENHLQP
jgi:hypothetical protein